MFKNWKRNKGITLVALVVTVIILLILAGISIASLTGNGLFEKAKLAKEKQEKAEELENERLSDYENKIESYISGNNRDSSVFKSEVFKDLSCTLEQIGGKIKVTIKPVFNEGKNEQNVFEYILVVDNNAYVATTETEAYINSVKAKTTYTVSILGIDNKVGMMQSENLKITTSDLTYTARLLEYPILTSKGMNNIIYECDQGAEYNYYGFDVSKGSTTASDSLGINAYDNDETTYVDCNVRNSYGFTKKIKLDPSVIGKKLLVKGNFDLNFGILFTDSSGNKITTESTEHNGSFVTGGEWSGVYWFGGGSMTAYAKIPEGAAEITFADGASGNSTLHIYGIGIE